MPWFKKSQHFPVEIIFLVKKLVYLVLNDGSVVYIQKGSPRWRVH